MSALRSSIRLSHVLQRRSSVKNGTSLGWRCYSSLQGKTVRIGCSSGFWGDTATAAPQLVRYGNIDYIVMDYLAEITMSLLTAAKQKSPTMGYAPDFVLAVMKPLLKDIKKKGIRVIANAGGVNPVACAQAVRQVAEQLDVPLRVGMVTGDDLMRMIDGVRGDGVTDIGSGAALPDQVQSMNAYLGAIPIATALSKGADVVITGRCVDSALALGPLIHEFDWKPHQYDLLSAGSLAGHLIECGAQSTGGIYTDWHKDNLASSWHNIGMPVVECASNGDFVLTKPPKTGGQVTWGTVAEQLVYEIGDPKAYIMPDVTCDFSNVKLQELDEPDSVLVTGARGLPPPEMLKVCATFKDGYRATAFATVIGRRAGQSARAVADAILRRSRLIFKMLGYQDFTDVHVQSFGSEETYGHPNPKIGFSERPSREALMWIGVRHPQKEALEMFSREIAAAGTGMAPGFTNMLGGRPRVAPVFRLFSFLYPRDKLEGKVVCQVNEDEAEVISLAVDSDKATSADTSKGVAEEVCSLPKCCQKSFPADSHLEDLALLRSGDKGNSANIGVIARCQCRFDALQESLTEDYVESFFKHLLEPTSSVHRYTLPGIGALNFLLTKSLGGGGVASPRPDPQGKAYAQMLAECRPLSTPIQCKYNS